MANSIPPDLRAPKAVPALAPTGTRIGHVHLRVSDLDRAVAFYRDVIGLEVTGRMGSRAAFLSAGGYHHHIGLNVFESEGGTPPPPGHTGLFHTAFLFPDRKALAQALARALQAGVTLDGHADHGVSEAVYFRDPDGNGIEIYRDKTQADRTGQGPGPSFQNDPLDLHALLSEA